jgi:hypothetical protein
MNSGNVYEAVATLQKTVSEDNTTNFVQINKYHVCMDFFGVKLSYKFDDAGSVNSLALVLPQYYSPERYVNFGSTSLHRLTRLPVTLSRSGKAYCISEGDKILAIFEDYYSKEREYTVNLKVAPDFKFDSFTGERVQLKMPLKDKTERDKISENKFVTYTRGLYAQVVTLASFHKPIPGDTNRYSKLCILPVPVVKYSESGIKAGIGYLKSYSGKITSKYDVLGLKKVLDDGWSPVGFISDINEDSLSELFRQMREYNLKTFPFIDNMVLVEVELNGACFYKGRILVPLKSLFSRFNLVPVTFNNINDVVDPLELSVKKVTSVYKEYCCCSNKFQHYTLGKERKIFYGDSVEVLCNKLTEIADEIRKQLQ